jgi:hypothetical protein
MQQTEVIPPAIAASVPVYRLFVFESRLSQMRVHIDKSSQYRQSFSIDRDHSASSFAFRNILPPFIFFVSWASVPGSFRETRTS